MLGADRVTSAGMGQPGCMNASTADEAMVHVTPDNAPQVHALHPRESLTPV